MALKFTPEEMMRFLDEVFPQVQGMFGIDRMDDAVLEMRLIADDRHCVPVGLYLVRRCLRWRMLRPMLPPWRGSVLRH